MNWAGITFQVVGHRDGRMLRAPGLFAFCRAGEGEGALMLFAGHAEDLASCAGPGHPSWVDALQLGMDELHVYLGVPRRIDRLQLLARIVRHVQPLLNVVDEVASPTQGVGLLSPQAEADWSHLTLRRRKGSS